MKITRLTRGMKVTDKLSSYEVIDVCKQGVIIQSSFNHTVHIHTTDCLMQRSPILSYENCIYVESCWEFNGFFNTVIAIEGNFVILRRHDGTLSCRTTKDALQQYGKRLPDAVTLHEHKIQRRILTPMIGMRLKWLGLKTKQEVNTIVYVKQDSVSFLDAEGNIHTIDPALILNKPLEPCVYKGSVWQIGTSAYYVHDLSVGGTLAIWNNGECKRVDEILEHYKQLPDEYTTIV